MAVGMMAMVMGLARCMREKILGGAKYRMTLNKDGLLILYCS